MVLIQKNLDPDRNTKLTVGQDTRNRWSGNENRLTLTGAGAAIASATNTSAIGFDLDLDEVCIFLEAGRSERLAATGTTGLSRGKNMFFDDSGQVGIISARRNRATGLLASATARSSPGGSRVGGSRVGGSRAGGSILSKGIRGNSSRGRINAGARLGFAAVKTLLERADLSFKFSGVSLQSGFTAFGGFKAGAVKASLLTSLKELRTIRTVGARKRRQRISGNSRRRRWSGRGRRSGRGRCSSRGCCSGRGRRSRRRGCNRRGGRSRRRRRSRRGGSGGTIAFTPGSLRLGI